MSKGAKLSTLLISLTILLMAALMSGVIQSSHWNITAIELDAVFKRVNSEQIRIVVAAYPERSFFKIKAETIRENLNEIPWVQKVSVNKKWPNKLTIKLIEHKAVAVWNNNQLLNAKGEIFEVDSIDNLAALPKINGKDSNASEIWNNYIRYNDIIKQIGYDIVMTKVTNRGGWDLHLSNGVNINLGSQQMDAKLVRLVETWMKLLNLNNNPPEYIDLRYTNGYVVRWPKNDINLSNRDINKSEMINNTGNTNG
jgi:cell division protein FtsQ